MKSDFLKFTILSSVYVFIVGCSSKDPIVGTRENIILSTDNASNLSCDIDTTPVVIDHEYHNREFSQRFINSSHYYAPLKFSTSFKELWSTKLDYASSQSIHLVSSPIVAEGKVFCIDAGGIVYAVAQKDGKILWRVSTTLIGKDGQIGGAIAYDNGRIIVTSSFSECFSINAKTGRIIWRIKLPASCKGDGITIHDGKAFVTCNNSSLQVIDIATGKIIWSHSGIMTDMSYIGSASVAIGDGLVFVAYQSGEIYALLLETGAVVWDSMFSRISLTDSARAFFHPRACPVVKDGIVYFVAPNEQTMAFETKTGKKIWESDYGSVQTPIVSGNSIFVFNNRSELVCMNRYTGAARWLSHLDKKHLYDWYGQILLKDCIAVLSSTGQWLLVSVYNGKIMKVMQLCEGVSVNPVIADGIMYILNDDGILFAYGVPSVRK